MKYLAKRQSISFSNDDIHGNHTGLLHRELQTILSQVYYLSDLLPNDIPVLPPLEYPQGKKTEMIKNLLLCILNFLICNGVKC